MLSKSNNLLLTEDGSITCRDQESGELYHNQAGAYSEALQHYVQVCDLNKCLQIQNAISVLDVCFGLGYNTFVLINRLIELTEQESFAKKTIICSITGIDKDPEILNIIKDVLDDPRLTRICRAFCLGSPIIENMITVWKNSGKYKLEFQGKAKLKIEIEMLIDDLRLLIPKLVGARYDYIFHDGFSPRSMPELWTADLFAQYVKMLNPHGRIITYSSAAAVRGAFKECGLVVRKSAPLGGKSGGTVAFLAEKEGIIDKHFILDLDDDESRRLESRSSIPYRDPNLNSTREEINSRRILEIQQSQLPKCY